MANNNTSNSGKDRTSSSSKNRTSSSSQSGSSMKDNHTNKPDNRPARSGPGGA
jgi:hypothetical protein